MSSLLFPYTLAGIQFNYLRYLMPVTGVFKSVAGNISTIAYQPYPNTHFEYSWEFLQDQNVSPAPLGLQQVAGLIGAVLGRYDSFLHTDPDFNTVTAQPFGTGNATAGPFQLVAAYGTAGYVGTPELVQNLNGTPTIYDNGVPVSSPNYSIGPTGEVTFASGHFPASGHDLTWAGSFYYRCRFDEDYYDLRKDMKGLWSLEKITFTSFNL